MNACGERGVITCFAVKVGSESTSKSLLPPCTIARRMKNTHQVPQFLCADFIPDAYYDASILSVCITFGPGCANAACFTW